MSLAFHSRLSLTRQLGEHLQHSHRLKHSGLTPSASSEQQKAHSWAGPLPKGEYRLDAIAFEAAGRRRHAMDDLFGGRDASSSDVSALQGKWQREKRASLILAYSSVALVAAGQRLASMPGSRLRREERFRRAGRRTLGLAP